MTQRFTRKLKRKRPGELIFDSVVLLVMLFLVIISVYPLVYVLSMSLSNGVDADSGKVWLLPVNPTIGAYAYLFKDPQFMQAFANSMFYMIVGAAYNMLISVPGAYVLARREFYLSKILNIYMTITLWLTAGTIPLYLNFKMLGMMNSRWAMIIGFGLTAFNIILIRNYFEGLPKEMKEAAHVDGASEFQTLFHVYIPLSKPILATVTMFYALGRWNVWFWHSLLLRDAEDKIPLQIMLRRILIATADDPNNTNPSVTQYLEGGASRLTIQFAVMAFTLVPVLVVYPYVQRHFTKGIMLGGVKN